MAPLTARLEPWQERLLSRPGACDAALVEHGSPLNLIDPEPLARNLGELDAAARAHGVSFGVYFARKANKSLALVDRAIALGCGVDVASTAELEQVLERGADPGRVVVTAAVKPRELLELCARSGALVVIDNADELGAARAAATSSAVPLRIAYRLAVTAGADSSPPTRFGMPVADIATLHEQQGAEPELRLEGLHFHVDGYDPEDRVRGLREALDLAAELEGSGGSVRFIDMGGGVPMRYLEDYGEWDTFWRRHRAALRGEAPLITYLGDALGASADDGARVTSVYPAAQRLIRGCWLERVLAAVGPELAARGIELRCEPGRALVDGAGMTLARVEFRKLSAAGDRLVGLAMNRTQMRTAAAEAMFDPLLVRPAGSGEPSGAFEGYLVGAYCIERELILQRRLVFGTGAAVGDIVAFPNTAGYFMHILESASHQMPLAANVVVEDGLPGARDPIDGWLPETTATLSR